jgi:hypothetical protein
MNLKVTLNELHISSTGGTLKTIGQRILKLREGLTNIVGEKPTASSGEA